MVWTSGDAVRSSAMMMLWRSLWLWRGLAASEAVAKNKPELVCIENKVLFASMPVAIWFQVLYRREKLAPHALEKLTFIVDNLKRAFTFECSLGTWPVACKHPQNAARERRLTFTFLHYSTNHITYSMYVTLCAGYIHMCTKKTSM